MKGPFLTFLIQSKTSGVAPSAGSLRPLDYLGLDHYRGLRIRVQGHGCSRPPSLLLCAVRCTHPRCLTLGASLDTCKIMTGSGTSSPQAHTPHRHQVPRAVLPERLPYVLPPWSASPHRSHALLQPPDQLSRTHVGALSFPHPTTPLTEGSSHPPLSPGHYLHPGCSPPRLAPPHSSHRQDTPLFKTLPWLYCSAPSLPAAPCRATSNLHSAPARLASCPILPCSAHPVPKALGHRST